MNIVSHNWQKKVVYGCVVVSGLTTVNSANVLAQITPDNSLGGQSSIVNPNGFVQEKPAIIIEGGARVENNLFHSLREFNISDGQQVYFANPAGIQNILTRVTEAQSLIDGTLGVDGTANLFLINPRGIIFGGNARLDIQGSFLASTADSIVFENGLQYSAVNPETPLLTMMVPVGLQFGQNVASINVEGTGHNIFANQETGAFFIDERNQGLTVQPQQTLAMIGGDVNLNGGNLTSPGGQIHLGSVSGEGFVGLNLTPQNWQFDYSNIQGFGNINLTNAASADVTGGSGKIDVRSGNLLLSDGSGLFALTKTEQPAGNIQVNVSDTLNIVGFSENYIFSGLFTETTGAGSAGDISVQTRDLRLENAGQISSSSFAEGSGGNININATNSIEANAFPSGIFAKSFSTGVSGNITINTTRLTLIETDIDATSSGSAINNTVTNETGGNLTVNASEVVELIGYAGLYARVSGNQRGGDLIVNTGRLIARDGAQVNASSFQESQGNSGNVFINAGVIELSGKGESPSGSGIFSETNGSGTAGKLTINANNLTLRDGAIIAVRSKESSTGGVGNLNITSTENITLYNSATIDATNAAGDQGNVDIQARNIYIINNSRITTNARETASSSQIKINSINWLIGVGNSDITANTLNGTVAPIEIIANRNFGFQRLTGQEVANLLNTNNPLEIDPTRLASNDITNFQQTDLTVNAPLVGELGNNFQLQPDFIQLPEIPINPSTLIARGCEAQPGQNTSSFINTGTGGLPPNPSTPYLGVSTWQDSHSQTLQNTQLMPNQPNSNQIREAQGFEWANANKTRIRLTANSRNVTPSSSWQIPGNCYGK